MKHDVQKTSFSFKEIFSNFFKILYVNLETLNAIFSVNFAWNHKVLVLYRKLMRILKMVILVLIAAFFWDTIINSLSYLRHVSS